MRGGARAQRPTTAPDAARRRGFVMRSDSEHRPGLPHQTPGGPVHRTSRRSTIRTAAATTGVIPLAVGVTVTSSAGSALGAGPTQAPRTTDNRAEVAAGFLAGQL